MLQKTLLISSVILLLTSWIFAGTTGKISGQVLEKNSNEPIPGVNVIIEGLPLGASTDVDGYFFILNIPPGNYKISAQMIGYSTQIIEDVKVTADLTSRLSFTLSEQIIDGEIIVIKAERQLIKKDETAKSVVIESSSFTEMPIKQFNEALTVQAGFTTDEDGEIHVRGGRSGEVAYMIDGIYVRDPYSGGFGSQIDKYSIEELQIITGGFNAEYGQAMSGIVNIVTKEGGKQYHGRIEYESLRLNDSPYRQEDWMLRTDIAEGLSPQEAELFEDGLRDSLGNSLYNEPAYDNKDSEQYMLMPGDFSLNFNGPVPFINNLTFFASGRITNDQGYLPLSYDKRREYNLKLTYFSSNIKLSLFSQINNRNYKPYSHRWKYNPDGYEDRESNVNRYGLILTHLVSNATFYELRLSMFNRVYNQYIPGKSATFAFNESLKTYELLESNFQRSRRTSDGFYFEGDRGDIDFRDIITYTAKADLVSQINKSNQLKIGLQLLYHDISRETYIQPWEGENHRYEKFNRKPLEIAIYIQDKLEYENFIINAGLRYDYCDPKHTMWPNLDVPGYIDEEGNWIASDEVSVKPKTQLSPRIGMGFPVTDRTVFYTSYGHFYQIPSYLEMYGPHKVDEDQPLIGNPAIKPQKTVAFEAGVKQQLGKDYALDVNFYFKDITNLAGSTYHGFFPYEYTLYDNSDYGSVNGIDFTLTKRFSNMFSGSINYTYSVAKGNESDPREGYSDYKRSNAHLRPKTLFYLDFDRRHDLSTSIHFALPEDFGFSIGKFHPIGDTQLNLLFTDASGLPYTPRVDDAGAGIRVEKNSARIPPSYNLDLKFQKRFKVAGLYTTAFLVVNNVFDRRNPVIVWSETGQPWDRGQYTSSSKDRIYNPTHVSEPRCFSLGLRIDF